MKTRWLTAVVDQEGNRLAVFDTDAEARAYASTLSSDVLEVSQYGGIEHATPERNPPKAPEKMPELAWRGVGYMHVTERELADLTLEDAVRRLRQLRMPDTGADWLLGVPRNEDGTVWVVPRQKMILVREGKSSRSKVKLGPDGQPLTSLVPLRDTVDDFVGNFLRSNDKLAKDHPGIKADALGLSLLPANYVSLKGGEGSGDLHGAGPVSAVDVLPHVFPRGVNLCRGSNEQCRKSCLVFSGHNDLQRHNRRKKEGMTVAFFMDPVAFCRVLLASIQKFTGTWTGESVVGSRKSRHPFCRLNVYSDIPWELVCPSLFRLSCLTDYYDYTKVPSRPEVCADLLASRSSTRRPLDVLPFPSNYHLTFSSSGDNDWYCYSEMQRGRKVAVVFETDKHRTPAWFSPSFWPQEAWFPVIPGDVSDIRPVDPSAEAMAQAIRKIGEPDPGWSEKKLKQYQSRLIGEAYRLTFGPDGAPRSLWAVPPTGPGIVGLHHKPPVVPEARQRQTKALEKRRLRLQRGGEGRLFLVKVKVVGKMIMAAECPITVAFGKAVVPEDQPLVRGITRKVQSAIPAAAKRRVREGRKQDDE